MASVILTHSFMGGYHNIGRPLSWADVGSDEYSVFPSYDHSLPGDIMEPESTPSLVSSVSGQATPEFSPQRAFTDHDDLDPIQSPAEAPESFLEFPEFLFNTNNESSISEIFPLNLHLLEDGGLVNKSESCLIKPGPSPLLSSVNTIPGIGGTNTCQNLDRLYSEQLISTNSSSMVINPSTSHVNPEFPSTSHDTTIFPSTSSCINSQPGRSGHNYSSRKLLTAQDCMQQIARSPLRHVGKTGPPGKQKVHRTTLQPKSKRPYNKRKRKNNHTETPSSGTRLERSVLPSANTKNKKSETWKYERALAIVMLDHDYQMTPEDVGKNLTTQGEIIPMQQEITMLKHVTRHVDDRSRKAARSTKTQEEKRIHNNSESNRRSELSGHFRGVRDLIPLEYFPVDVTSKKKVPSKKDILDAAINCVLHMCGQVDQLLEILGYDRTCEDIPSPLELDTDLLISQLGHNFYVKKKKERSKKGK